MKKTVQCFCPFRNSFYSIPEGLLSNLHWKNIHDRVHHDFEGPRLPLLERTSWFFLKNFFMLYVLPSVSADPLVLGLPSTRAQNVEVLSFLLLKVIERALNTSQETCLLVPESPFNCSSVLSKWSLPLWPSFSSFTKWQPYQPRLLHRPM